MNAAPETTPTTLETTPAAEPAPPGTLRDSVEDAVRAFAVRALDTTRRGLQASARWLEARASDVESLAVKIA